MIIAGQMMGERFEVRRRIGSGGTGDVFEAFDRDRGAVIAIKTLARADGDIIARFKREFRALQSTAHPNLVSIGELICIDELWFFTMELVDGSHFLENVRGDYDKLRARLRQLVDGLRALHESGLVHRDIKPSNVMVTRQGRVVLLDFGLVTNLDPARQSIAHGPIGTVEYMAPEQATGRQVGEAADWYAVGVMLYEALTGKMPHSGHTLQILVQKQEVEPTPVQELVPNAPEDLCKLCSELLAIEPSARPTGEVIARRLGIDTARAARTSTPVNSTVFVGRSQEREALERSAVAARTRPCIHLVVGESGIGKSELVAHFTRELSTREPDAIVLGGRCYERESVPYKAFDGIADALAQTLAVMPVAEVRTLLPTEAGQLVRLFPVFQRVEAIAAAPALERDSAEPHEQRRQMFIALRAVFAALARARRVVLTIDDLQWSDADSFLLLRELVRGPDAPALLVLATVRGGDTGLSAALEGLPIERTLLGPLNADECRTLAEELMPGAGSRFDLERLSREAGGHPMFLQEILRHLDLAGAGSEARATLDDALSARVALLRPEARTLLEVVCIAGAPISLDTAAQACRLDATAVTRSIASLRVATLVREIQRGRHLALEPYHDRVRESVGSSIAATARRDLHARIAYALEAAHEPRDPQLLLRNFLLAELPDRAARYAEDAAQRSEAARAFDQAAELWRTALDTIPRAPDDRRRVLLRLGQALINAGRGSDAAAQYLAAAEGADRATRLECHRNAAEQHVISGHIAPGIATLEALLQEIGVSYPRTPRRMLASLLWNRAQVRIRGLGFRERQRREIADATMLELEVLNVAAYSLAMIDAIRGMDFQTRHLRMALRTGYREHIVKALLIESMFMATGGNPKRAEHYIVRALAIGADPSDPYVRGMSSGARGVGAYFGGDIVTAVTFLEEALGMMRRMPGNHWEKATGKLFQLFALRFIGDYDALRAKYGEYITDATDRGDRYLESTVRRACVPMWLAADDADGAVRELERATWVPPAGRFHVQHFHELVAWSEIALHTGTLDPRAKIVDGFAKVRDSMLLRVESVRVQNEYILGRLAIAGHLPRQEAVRAARKLARETNGLAGTWSPLIAAGDVADTDPAQAALLYERAVVAAERAGMRATAAVAQWRVATLREDEPMKANAEAALTALGVRNAAKLCAVIAPTRGQK